MLLSCVDKYPPLWLFLIFPNSSQKRCRSIIPTLVAPGMARMCVLDSVVPIRRGDRPHVRIHLNCRLCRACISTRSRTSWMHMPIDLGFSGLCVGDDLCV